MRAGILSARWFRFFLSLTVLGAIFSSPLHVILPSLSGTSHGSPPSPLRRGCSVASHHRSNLPLGIKRVRFVRSLEDRDDETPLKKASETPSAVVRSLDRRVNRPDPTFAPPSLLASPPLRVDHGHSYVRRLRLGRTGNSGVRLLKTRLQRLDLRKPIRERLSRIKIRQDPVIVA